MQIVEYRDFVKLKEVRKMNSEKRKEQNNQDSRCFAQETLIRMADGQEKRINAIRAGDKVLSVSGEDVRVMNIISGIEEKVVVLVTQSGKRIRLTSDHPVQTRQRGVQPVKALLVTDKVKTADGNFEEIDSLYTEMYNDRVYNLCLEKESFLFGNGIAVGDFDSQQNIPRSVPTPPVSEEAQHELDILKEEFRKLQERGNI